MTGAIQESVRIPLRARDGSIRAYAIVDAADATWLNQWHWSLSHGYAVRGTYRGGVQRSIRMHRELMASQLSKGLTPDHINRNRLDNRRANLRVITQQQNMQNQASQIGRTSIFRGVHFDRQTGLWRAEVKTAGKRFRLGRFASEVDAAEAARIVRLREMPYATE